MSRITDATGKNGSVVLLLRMRAWEVNDAARAAIAAGKMSEAVASVLMSEGNSRIDAIAKDSALSDDEAVTAICAVYDEVLATIAREG